MKSESSTAIPVSYGGDYDPTKFTNFPQVPLYPQAPTYLTPFPYTPPNPAPGLVSHDLLGKTISNNSHGLVFWEATFDEGEIVAVWVETGIIGHGNLRLAIKGKDGAIAVVSALSAKFGSYVEKEPLSN